MGRPQMQQLQVVVPAGMTPGQQFYAKTPDNLLLQVQAPEGVSPGQPFLVQYEPPQQRQQMFMQNQFSQQNTVGNMMPRTRKKRPKDPNAPKRASNAYMIFCKERRARLKEERPDLPFGRIGARLGEIWRSLSADEKKPYEEKANIDRQRYKEEMKNYSGPAVEKRQKIEDNRERVLSGPMPGGPQPGGAMPYQQGPPQGMPQDQHYMQQQMMAQQQMMHHYQQRAPMAAGAQHLPQDSGNGSSQMYNMPQTGNGMMSNSQMGNMRYAHACG